VDSGALCDSAIADGRTLELTEEHWTLVEPGLRETQRVDNRGHPWQDTRAVLNGSSGYRARGRSIGLRLRVIRSFFRMRAKSPCQVRPDS
jgi:hypothetical protein